MGYLLGRQEKGRRKKRRTQSVFLSYRGEGELTFFEIVKEKERHYANHSGEKSEGGGGKRVSVQHAGRA